MGAKQPGKAGVRKDQESAGLLTRAGFLASVADEDSSGPVPRGVFVMDKMLCQPSASPPANINIPTAPVPAVAAQQMLTTRQRFSDQHLNQPFCVACHTTIDGFGFGFEEFDGMGVYRTMENGQKVDDSGMISLTSDVNGPFNGAVELQQKLAGSKTVATCATKQMYRFISGGVESPASAPALTKMQTGFTGDSHLTDPFLAFIASNEFVYRLTAH